jgi:hypothetical protein
MPQGTNEVPIPNEQLHRNTEFVQVREVGDEEGHGRFGR